MKKLSLFVMVTWLALVPACGEGAGSEGEDTGFAAMEGPAADCEYDVVTFRLPDGSLQEVSINGLPVEKLAGAEVVDKTTVTATSRRGVRFSRILEKAKIAAPDEVPVNCVARDGWDPLRTVLQNDLAKLTTFSFLRDHGYVYVGNAGDKDPLYPEMEGRTLIVDYDLGAADQLPEYLGDNLAALNIFRWKMLEKYDATQQGTIEIDPQVE